MDNNYSLVCPRCNLRYQYLVNFCSSCGWFMREPFTNTPKIEYNFQKGVYPAGQYVAGRDLSAGGYILTPTSKNQEGQVTIYKSYTDFVNEEMELSWYKFSDIYHLVVTNDNYLIVIENAYITKIS